LNTKAIEKYLERCSLAKQMKLEQELIEMQKLGGCVLSSGHSSVTKGKAPSFMRRGQYQQHPS
jgi:hypothetical protein